MHHTQVAILSLILSTLVVFGYEDKSNYRSCSLVGDVDTLGTYSSFMDNCAITENSTSACDGAYNVLQNILTTTVLGNIADFSSYIDYFDWGLWMKTNNRLPMFYANTGLCPDIVHRVSEIPGVLEITLEDQSGSRSIANHAWCDASHFSNTSGTCDNTTIWGEVPNYISPETNEVFNYNGAAFYVPASEKFAEESFDVPRVLIRSFQKSYGNGTVSDVPAYIPTSVFASYEMPTLFQNPNVTGINVLVVTNENQPLETCDSGSVQQLQNTISGHYGYVVCLIDPPCVLHVICEETLNPSVNISNKADKCKYYNDLIDQDASYNSNCNCTTGWIDGAAKTSNDCPKILSDSGVGQMEIHLWAVFIIVTLLSYCSLV